MGEWAGRRVLITGATGFIGRRLTPRLMELGAQVTALVAGDLPRRSEMGWAESVDWREADLRYREGVRRGVQAARPEVVFHLAAAGVTDPFLPVEAALRTNLAGALNLLESVRGQARVVVARTPGEVHCTNVYNTSKAAAWAFCRMYHRTQGWPIVGMMLFQTYGPGQPAEALLPAALAAAREGRDFPLTPGEQVRDWVFIDDVVEALLCAGLASELDGESLEVGTGVGHSVREVVERVYALVDSPARPLAGALPYRPGEVMHQVADAERTRARLGWRAKIGLEAGLKRLL